MSFLSEIEFKTAEIAPGHLNGQTKLHPEVIETKRMAVVCELIDRHWQPGEFGKSRESGEISKYCLETTPEGNGQAQRLSWSLTWM